MNALVQRYRNAQLFRAIRKNDLTRVERALSAGAQANAPHARYHSPLLAALTLHRPHGLVERLTAAGANVLAAGPCGSTPVELAGRRGDWLLVQILMVAVAAHTGTH